MWAATSTGMPGGRVPVFFYHEHLTTDLGYAKKLSWPFGSIFTHAGTPFSNENVRRSCVGID